MTEIHLPDRKTPAPRPSLPRRSFFQSCAATSSFLACYGVINRARADIAVRITPPEVDQLSIQVVMDGKHDIFISGDPVPGVGIERVRGSRRNQRRDTGKPMGPFAASGLRKGRRDEAYLLDYGWTADGEQ